MKNSPIHTLTLSVIATLLLCFAAVWLSLFMPRFGIDLTHVDEQLRMNQHTIIALANPQQRLLLNHHDVLEEPDVLNDLDEMNHFFARQGEISQMLLAASANATPLWLEDDLGHHIALSPSQAGWQDLPLSFWLQLLVGLTGVLAGVGTWVFCQQNPAARYYCIMGIALALSAWAAAVYGSRELAMPALWFRLLSHINELGALLFGGALVALTWHYPEPYKAKPVAMYTLLSVIGCWLMLLLQWLPSIDETTRIPGLLCYLVAIVMMVMQWRKHRNRPDLRLAMQWFFLVTFGGIGLFLGLIFVPPLLGFPLVISQAMGFAAFLLIYLGLAVGIVRYRLFNLGRWWFTAWLWIMSAMVVIALDLLTMLLFGLQGAFSLSIAVAITGWLYFPLRRYVWQHLLQRSAPSLDAVLPDAVRAIAGSSSVHDAVAGWHSLMQQVFEPLESSLESLTQQQEGLNDNALTLVVRSPDQQQLLYLRFPAQGQRVFSDNDLLLAQSIGDLFSHAIQALRAKEQGIEQERDRIRQDIHDTLGGKILSMMHASEQPEIRAMAQSAWQEMREILSALDNEPQSLMSALNRWQHMLAQQLAMQNVHCRWHKELLNNGEARLWSGAELLNLGRIIQEAINNAVRHAQAQHIDVLVHEQQQQVDIQVRHDGHISEPKTWQHGRGLTHMLQRVQMLGGQLQWSVTDDGLLRLTITIPCVGEPL